MVISLLSRDPPTLLSGLSTRHRIPDPRDLWLNDWPGKHCQIFRGTCSKMLLPPGSPPPPKTRAARVGPWSHLVSTWTLSVPGRAAGTQKRPSAQPAKAHLGWLASQPLLGAAYLLFILPPVLLTNPQARAKRCPTGQAPSGLSCTLGSCPPLLCLLCPGAKTLLGQPAGCSRLISKHMASRAWRPVAPQLAPPLRAGRGAGKGLPLVALAHSPAIPLPLLLLPLGSSGSTRVSEEHSQCCPSWDGKS